MLTFTQDSSDLFHYTKPRNIIDLKGVLFLRVTFYYYIKYYAELSADKEMCRATTSIRIWTWLVIIDENFL